TTIALQRIVYVLDQQYDELDVQRDNPHFTEDTTLDICYSEILAYYIERLVREVRVPNVPILNYDRWLLDVLRGAHALTGLRRDAVADRAAAVALKCDPRI